MKFHVAGANDQAAWQNALGRFPDADAYYLPEYHRVYELNGDGTSLAFTAETENEFFFILSFCGPSLESRQRL